MSAGGGAEGGPISFVLAIVIVVSFAIYFNRSDSKIDKTPYPGKISRFGECSYLWDLGWLRDPGFVEKCEKHMTNPKFKQGQRIKFKTKFDRRCDGIIVNNARFSNAPHVATGIYSVKVYCGKERMHDEWCEKNNILNCPTFGESELK